VKATAWDNDMEKLLVTLGDEGWELVAITTRSSYLGSMAASELKSYGGVVTQNDYAGFTDNEIWVFKRPKN